LNRVETINIKRYSAIRNTLSLLEPVVILITLVLIQFSGVSLKIRDLCEGLSKAVPFSIIIYSVLFGTICYIATFSIKLYKGFILEHRFDLSNQNIFAWIKDELKKAAISMVLFIVFVEFLYLLLHIAPKAWWLYLSLGWLLLTILFAKLFPVLIMPLFFKFEDLKDDDLKKRLMGLAKRFGITVLDVYKMGLSAKTKKANAALTGMGNTRRIILGDTLIQAYSKDEIEVVLAHELAHYKLIHIWKLVLFGAVSMLTSLFLTDRIFHMLAARGIVGPVSDIAYLPSILALLSFFGILLSPLQNSYSRSLERAADMLALKMTGLSDAFISCMTKLSRQNLSDPSPGRFIEIILYDHPPISKRIRLAATFDSKRR